MNYLDVTYDFDMIHNALLFFSGNKGFHVYIPAIVFGNWKPSIDLPSKHKALANKILKEGTFDPAIYEMKRIFRIVNTKHQKSGLFKIQLQWDTVTNKPESIVKIARYLGIHGNLTKCQVQMRDYQRYFNHLGWLRLRKRTL